MNELSGSGVPDLSVLDSVCPVQLFTIDCARLSDIQWNVLTRARCAAGNVDAIVAARIRRDQASMQIALVLSLLLIALVVIALELLSVDVVALGAVLLLIVTGCIGAEQAFTSFGTDMMVLLAAIFIIAGALLKTGVLDSVGVFLYQHCGGQLSCSSGKHNPGGRRGLGLHEQHRRHSRVHAGHAGGCAPL